MPYDKSQASREFDRWSRSYDRSILQRLLFGPSHRALIERIQPAIAGRAATILDVGCGTGVFASLARSAFPEATVWGVDLVAAMIERGRDRWKSAPGRGQVVQGDSERLPFAAGSFDVVTCSNSFHHYPNQARAIAEMRRVLKPGGRLLLIDGCRDHWWGWLIYDVCVATIEGEVHHASAGRVRDLFDRSGFVATNQRAYPGLAPFLLSEGVTRAAVAEPSPVLATSRVLEAVGGDLR
jgi:ubiquinone/menaquinone biosynthesis C-methylase UbiE